MKSDLDPEDLEPTQEIYPMSERKRLSSSALTLLIGVLAVLSVMLLVGVIAYTSLFESKTPSSTNTPDTSQTATQSVEPGCTNFHGSMTAPTQMKVESMAVESPMVVVDQDEDGNPGAPDPDDGFTTAWYQRSAAPGQTKGNVILTIHTYSKGTALGNELLDFRHGLEEGDVLKITDVDGNQVCYQYTGQRKVWVNEYDPDSGIFHNLDGPPQLAIMVCDDWDKASQVWKSRVIFYAKKV